MKITDIEPYSDLKEPILHKYLEYVGSNHKNVSGKSNKFWEVAIFKKGGGYMLVRRWGKYGSKGQLKEEFFSSKWTAENAAEVHADKKRDKGYTKEVDIVARLATLVDED
jgi:predicted DNA-binding WGR domain protein